MTTDAVFVKWLLGLDLRNRCGGPLQFARFLKERDSSTQVTALHVLEKAQRDFFLLAKMEEKAGQLAQAEINKVLAREQVEGILDKTELHEDGEPIAALKTMATEMGVNGILIGRAAPVGEDPIVRLGKVARSLIRVLPAPVIVSPPDLSFSKIGDGPVVLATEAGEHSDGAVRFAKSMAKAMDRELLLVHVAPMPMGWGEEQLPKETLQYAWSQYGATAQRDLERWAKTHGLQGQRSAIGGGWVPAEIMRIAREQHASMIVCGSRRLDRVQRLFVNSVGGELAAQSDCPVAIVPNDYGSEADGLPPEMAPR